MRWSDEELRRPEVGVVGAFPLGCHDAGIVQFCLFSATGSGARSRHRYARVMSMKEDTVRNVGLARLGMLRSGIIVGYAHTWLRSVGREPSCLERLAILNSEFPVR